MQGLITIQVMYVWCNIEVHSLNHCCSGKEILITYYECVFVDLAIQQAKRMRHIVIYDLPRLKYFSTYSINGTI